MPYRYTSIMTASYFFDGEASIRLVFQVKEPQDVILIKMSALFSFAATLKLTLISNEFFTEKPH